MLQGASCRLCTRVVTSASGFRREHTSLMFAHSTEVIFGKLEEKKIKT